MVPGSDRALTTTSVKRATARAPIGLARRHAVEDFTLKHFLRTAARWGSLAGGLIGLIAGPLGLAGPGGLGFWEALLVRTALGGFLGFIIAGLLYLVFVGKSLHSLQIEEDEADFAEVVLRESRGSVAHFRLGQPWRFWGSVGGKLFLTNSRLIFKAHKGQP